MWELWSSKKQKKPVSRKLKKIQQGIINMFQAIKEDTMNQREFPTILWTPLDLQEIEVLWKNIAVKLEKVTILR